MYVVMSDSVKKLKNKSKLCTFQYLKHKMHTNMAIMLSIIHVLNLTWNHYLHFSSNCHQSLHANLFGFLQVSVSSILHKTYLRKYKWASLWKNGTLCMWVKCRPRLACTVQSARANPGRHFPPTSSLDFTWS